MAVNLKNTKTKTIINFVLAIIFITFAFLQLNDPDPLVWFSIYASVGLICLIVNFFNIPNIIIWLFMAGLFVYAGTLFMYFSNWLQIEHKEEILGKMVYEKPYLEGTREFLGLAMGVAALLYQLKKDKS